MREKLNLEERVGSAAQRGLERLGAVGPVELLLDLGFLSDSAFRGWQQQHPAYLVLEEHIQCGEKKLARVFELFRAWIKREGLEPTEAVYQSTSVAGHETLCIFKNLHPETEIFFRTRYRQAGLSDAQKNKLDKKLNKPAELVVFVQTSDEAICQECQLPMEPGDMFCLHQQQPLCLDCADLSHLTFLPSGDATLTRRAKKASPLHAVVLKFSRRRKRYERQGMLVTEASIIQAEASMEQDADQRAKQRLNAAVRRDVQDDQLVAKMLEVIERNFPNCPADSAREIAQHTAKRGSGRVGRSAAGRAADEQAVRLAVIAHIRHQHTEYDELLMSGVERFLARDQIRDEVQSVLNSWS